MTKSPKDTAQTSVRKKNWKPVPVNVLTAKMLPGDEIEIIDERCIEFTRVRDREWLVRHIEWALRNNHGVQVRPKD